MSTVTPAPRFDNGEARPQLPIDDLLVPGPASPYRDDYESCCAAEIGAIDFGDHFDSEPEHTALGLTPAEWLRDRAAFLRFQGTEATRWLAARIDDTAALAERCGCRSFRELDMALRARRDRGDDDGDDGSAGRARRSSPFRPRATWRPTGSITGASGPRTRRASGAPGAPPGASPRAVPPCPWT